MIRFLQRFIDAAYAKGYQRGLDDGLEQAARQRAEALEKVWAVIDDNAGGALRKDARGGFHGRDARVSHGLPGSGSTPGASTTPAPLTAADSGNVVAIHLRRADGKWHL